MAAQTLSAKLISWASDIEPGTVEQALRTSRLPFVHDHVSLMPDAHVGMGATVGSVIPTVGAIMPAAVGVDIGCGMVAAQTDLTADDLPDDLGRLLTLIEERVPAGVGRGHGEATRRWDAFVAGHGVPDNVRDDPKTAARAPVQFGTLGSGNHFVEICLDERGRVWTFLHSGSRGVGNRLATRHIEAARGLMGERLAELEDPDLAHLVEGTPEFAAYVADMLWSQAYAYESRAAMIAAVTDALLTVVGRGQVVSTVNTHHNFTQREDHAGQTLWITRKGAIDASDGELGLIPGSMATGSYVVRGRGSAASWRSCSHGAGRRMSRGQARRTLTAASLGEAMGDRTWQGRTPRSSSTSTRWPTRTSPR